MRIFQHGAAIAALVTLVTAADARLWKPTDVQLANDYTMITHNRGAAGTVGLHWMASPTMTSPSLTTVLDKYIVLSIQRSHISAEGTPIFDEVIGVQVSDGNGQVLNEVPQDQVPPILVGVIAAAQAMVGRASPTGKNVRFLVYQAGAVSACRSGRLNVAYDGETYTFDTPIPGCQKK